MFTFYKSKGAGFSYSFLDVSLFVFLLGVSACQGATKKTQVRSSEEASKETELSSNGSPPGVLDPDDIRSVVRAHIEEVRDCYNKGLAKNPNLQGRVELRFTIAAAGEVSDSLIQASSVKDEAVGTCIAEAVKTWKFPKPQGGGTVIVSYPFVLSPG